MPRLSREQRNWLLEAARRYREALPGSRAEEYLAKRGIPLGTAQSLGLGVVDAPMEGHDRYGGMIAVPYLRRGYAGWNVASLRFRCIHPTCEAQKAHVGHGKMNSTPGDRPRLYNTADLLKPCGEIAICEGEFDTITATLMGLAAVGVQGTQGWRRHFAEAFAGYRVVWILAQSDDSGQSLAWADEIAAQLPNARILPAPAGHDVNSAFINHGNYLQGKIQCVIAA